MNKSHILAYIIAVISEFGVAHGLTPQQSYRYLNRYRGLDFVERNYEVEHTLSFQDVVEDLTIYCQRNGGAITL